MFSSTVWLASIVVVDERRAREEDDVVLLHLREFSSRYFADVLPAPSARVERDLLDAVLAGRTGELVAAHRAEADLTEDVLDRVVVALRRSRPSGSTRRSPDPTSTAASCPAATAPSSCRRTSIICSTRELPLLDHEPVRARVHVQRERAVVVGHHRVLRRVDTALAVRVIGNRIRRRRARVHERAEDRNLLTGGHVARRPLRRVDHAGDGRTVRRAGHAAAAIAAAVATAAPVVVAAGPARGASPDRTRTRERNRRARHAVRRFRTRSTLHFVCNRFQEKRC